MRTRNRPSRSTVGTLHSNLTDRFSQWVRARRQHAIPGDRAGFREVIRVLKALPCDIFLGAHGAYFDLEKKYAKFKAGDATALPPGLRGHP